VVVAAALIIVLAGCGGASTALEVGDRSISRQDLLEQVEDWGAAADDPSPVGVGAGLSAQWSSWWIRFNGLDAWAAAEGIVVTDADRATARQSLEQSGSFPGLTPENNSALAQLVEWQALIDVVSRNPELLRGNVLCSRHILLDSEAEADEVLALLEEGEDFGDLARERSTDPSAATNAGDLGCAPRGSFVPEFEDAAYGAEPGDVVGPVETQFGFHVIEVLPVPESALGAAAGAVQGGLISGESPLYGEVFADREVGVDPRFGSWDARRNAVVPPLPADPAVREIVTGDTGS
jgi:hypothetical protein